MDAAELISRKRALRRELLGRRGELDAATQAAASRTAAWAALAGLPWRERPKVSLFWSLAGEIDTAPLLHSLHWLGAAPLLPRMNGFGRPLSFHAWTPALELTAGPMGVMQPTPDRPPELPDLVLAPLLAFDRRGGRLGYGAGFYDRTFADLAARGCWPLRVGFAFAAQEVAEVPVDGSDVPLEGVVTEAGVRFFRE
jgi:5-formyltetrahydrofolate cyclo-ligase